MSVKTDKELLREAALAAISERLQDKTTTDYFSAVLVGLTMGWYSKRRFVKSYPVLMRLLRGEEVSEKELRRLFEAGMMTAYVLAKNLKVGARETERLYEKADAFNAALREKKDRAKNTKEPFEEAVPDPEDVFGGFEARFHREG